MNYEQAERFVSALERIADALTAKTPPLHLSVPPPKDDSANPPWPWPYKEYPGTLIFNDLPRREGGFQ